MDPILETTHHRPYPLPSRPWRMSQRWNDLLFAHWPVPASEIQSRLPAGLQVDTFDGSAWLGVVPFSMDRIRHRLHGQTALTIPGVSAFPELNLRTYVRSRSSGLSGVFFFSLDAASLLAVLGARLIFHLPYFWASMRSSNSPSGEVTYRSRRLFSRHTADFNARYRGLGRLPSASPSQPGTIDHFLTERYCLFTSSRSRLLVGHIHHLPWPLEPAEADISSNLLPEAHGFTVPSHPPLLHFSRSLQVFIWSLEPDSKIGLARTPP